MGNQFAIVDAYVPTAVYYELADSVEYMREDAPCVQRRIDDHLTLAWNLDRSKVIGFRLKGFRNFFLRELQPTCSFLDSEFLSLVYVVEKVCESLAAQLGAEAFDEDRKKAYNLVHKIAQEDCARLSSLPKAA